MNAPENKLGEELIESLATAGEKSLKENWDAITTIEAVGQSLAEAVEAAKWALAKRLSDEYEAGKSQAQIARETGRARQTVHNWVRVHRRYGASLEHGLSFGQAYQRVLNSSEPNSVTTTRAQARKQLREQPEEIATEVAKALEKPEVAKVVMAKMTPEARKAITPDPRPDEVADVVAQMKPAERKKMVRKVTAAAEDADIKERA
jgi:predicted transcriptional regulator